MAAHSWKTCESSGILKCKASYKGKQEPCKDGCQKAELVVQWWGHHALMVDHFLTNKSDKGLGDVGQCSSQCQAT